MKKLLLLFILLISFISYADDSNDYCSNSNLKIQNLLKANDSKQIYSYLSDSYIYYYNKCGNTDNLKLLIDKYISLINSDSNNVRFYDNMYLLHILRPFLNDAQYYSFKKNAVVKYVKHDKEFLLYDYLPDIYKIDISKYQAEEYNNLLDCPYFHIVTTVPSELNDIALYNQKTFYNILFKAHSESIMTLTNDPKWLGAKVGITSILHTWGQTLELHPHIHSIVTGGGLKDNKWINSKDNYLFINLLQIIY